MQQIFTKAMARNIFLGSAAIFLVIYIALSVDTWLQIPIRDHADQLTDSVKRGKYLMDTNNCIGCHTLNGEGAYFAPELGNVYVRRGPEFIKAWIQTQPTGIPGRRQMPHFEFTDAQYDDLNAFFKWMSNIDTNKWPPNTQG